LNKLERKQEDKDNNLRKRNILTFGALHQSNGSTRIATSSN